MTKLVAWLLILLFIGVGLFNVPMSDGFMWLLVITTLVVISIVLIWAIITIME